MWISLALRYWRPLAGCLAALAVAGAIAYKVHAYGSSRYKAGYTAAETHYRGVIQRRDAEDAAALEAITAANRIREENDRARIEAARTAYAKANAEVSRIRSDNARLLERVRQLIADRTHAVPGGAADSGGTVAAAVVTELPAGAAGDLVEFANDCANTRQRESAQLVALIDVLRKRQPPPLAALTLETLDPAQRETLDSP